MVRLAVHREARSGHLARFEELTGLSIEGPDGRNDRRPADHPALAQPHPRAADRALQNGIFDEFLGLVEARIDAARVAGTLDLGVRTIAVEHFEVLSDTLLRTDALSGATTHLLELEIARALKPLTLARLEELYGLTGIASRSCATADRAALVCSCLPAACSLTTAPGLPGSN